MNFPSFLSSGNLNSYSSTENLSHKPPTNGLQKNQRKHKKYELPQYEQKISDQAIQEQDGQINFGESNEDGSHLPSGTQLGSAHLSQETEQETEHSNDEKKSRLDEMFDEARKSQGESNLLYKHRQNQQEERKLVHKSIQEALSQQATISSSLAKKHLITFKYLKFDINDYTITEILGKGAHGLVIKMKKGKDREDREDLIFNDNMMNDVIIKLYSKKYEKAFLDEAVILSMSQKAKQHSLHLDDFGDYRCNHFQNGCFQTDKYYGLFIKAGLGSLWDFIEYLKKTNKELSEQEAFVFLWSLLDTVYCLHEADICHRDIKPGNIVINPATFLPELIDYSLASEISKAEGEHVGTKGYRMKDFYMEDQVHERRDKAISRDYFALGITILNIMFPDDRFQDQKHIKDRLEKLEKFKDNLEKRILAETIKTCIFGEPQTKKLILEKYLADYFATDFWLEEDKSKKEELEYIYWNLNPWKLEDYAKKLKKNHFEDFRKYLAEKWTISENNNEFELQKHASSLIPQEVQIKENFKENPLQTLEMKSFSNEEQYIRNNFIKAPEKAMEKCYEVIYALVQTNHQTSDSQLYSTLMAVLYFNNFLDDAIALGEMFTGAKDGVLLNNLAFLKTQRNLRDYPERFSNEYELDSLCFVEEDKKDFIEDLAHLCQCASEKRIKRNVYIEGKKELILADFEMNLKHKKFYTYMNFCYMKACQVDQFLEEQTRKKIKDFVFGVNISERPKILLLLKITANESLLIALLDFCEILRDLTELDGGSELNNTLKKITDDKKEIAQLFEIEEGAKIVWNFLLKHFTLVTMIGFIILYNLKYDLITKFDVHEWASSDEGKDLQATLSNEKLNERIRELQAEQDKIWSRQGFLDSTLTFLKEFKGSVIRIPLVFEENEGEDVSRLSILGQQLNDIFLADSVARKNSHHLSIDFNQNLISVSAVQLTFKLSEESREINKEFFANLKSQSVVNLERLRLEFCEYDENFSNRPLEEICNKIDLLRLKELKIRMEEKIGITDQDFLLISKMISKQEQLNDLSLEFNLCLITSETIKSLARKIQHSKSLQRITLIFKNCSKIESKSIFFFLETMKSLPTLRSLNLYFAACAQIKSLEIHEKFSFELNIKPDLVEILEDSFMNDHGWESDLLFLEDSEEGESSYEIENDDCEIDENEDLENDLAMGDSENSWETDCEDGDEFE